jgi:hypothetical protein
MFDRNGTKVTRGTRVMVRFEDHGPEHAPFEWTGKVVGPSRIDGRIKVKSEFVTWKPAIHLTPADITRLADQSAPIQYRELREYNGHSGRVHIAPLTTDAAYYAWTARLYAACAWTRGNPLMAMVG